MLPSVLSFGAFEFDVVGRDLRKYGRPVKLDPLAAKLLALLLDEPCQLVFYDQIRGRLWGSTHVAYGTGIRRCLAQIRAALGDKARTPVYIQTVRGRGLRFIAPVRARPVESPDATVESPQARDGTLEAPIRQAATLVLPWVQRYLLTGSTVVVFGVLIMAVLASAYGLAILAFGIGAGLLILVYQGIEDTLWKRAIIATYMMAAMCYVSNASTLPEVQGTIINMTALPPALSYQFVMGLRFVPLYVLILGFWVFLGGHRDAGFLARPGFEKTYMLLGILFLSATLASLAIAAGDGHIWNVGLPDRWALSSGYAVVFALNVAVWFAGRRCFRRAVISSYRPLFSFCAIAYLPLALAAFVTDHEQNRINKYDLDLRWPQPYAAANPGALQHLGDLGIRSLTAEVGPDLRHLLNDTDFREALRNGTFYRQHWDEPFQVLSRSAMFGYRRKSPLTQGRLPFVVIRFPRELADALRFQPVGVEK